MPAIIDDMPRNAAAFAKALADAMSPGQNRLARRDLYLDELRPPTYLSARIRPTSEAPSAIHPVATYDPQVERDRGRAMVLQLGGEALVLTPEQILARIADLGGGTARAVHVALRQLSTEAGGSDLTPVRVRRIFEAVLAEVLRP